MNDLTKMLRDSLRPITEEMDARIEELSAADALAVRSALVKAAVMGVRLGFADAVVQLVERLGPDDPRAELRLEIIDADPWAEEHGGADG